MRARERPHDVEEEAGALELPIRWRMGDTDAVGRLVVGGPDRPQLVEVVRRGHPLDTPLEQRKVERRGHLDGADLARLPGDLAVVPPELRPVVLEDRRLALPVVVPSCARGCYGGGRRRPRRTAVRHPAAGTARRSDSRYTSSTKRWPGTPNRGVAGERLRHPHADAGEILPGGEGQHFHAACPGTRASASTIRSAHSRWCPRPATSGTVSTS
jgi:hypothetical protein